MLSHCFVKASGGFLYFFNYTNAHQKGANEYIVKPVDMNALADLVNKLKKDWNLAEWN